MTVTCPNGHESATTDYCDQCGARIEAAAPAPTPPPAPEAVAPEAPAAPTPAPAAQPCPVCGAPRSGDDRFCEGCGYDFTAGTTPGTWQLVVTADRDYFERLQPAGVEFPAHCPPRTFALTGSELRVGRHSSSRGIQPEIDLSGAPEDSAISHLHAMLIRQPNGSYSLVDPGSTNGTTLNDSADPIAVNVPVPLADGDRIHLGAWTTMTIHSQESTIP